jgi:homoserine kinase
MIEIRIPATSANMGPGFDCLGIALNMYNKIFIEEYDGETIIKTFDTEFNNKTNLIYTSMLRCFEKIGYKPKGINLNCLGDIPVSRGLGSSAACIVGGILGANELAGNILSKDDILEIATEIEGHPDNITPALLGGMTVSIVDNGKVYYEKVNIKNDLKLYALIPDFKLSTAEARAVLPKTYDLKDSIFNISRACLMIAAFSNGNLNLLEKACEDKLHQSYRGKLIKNYDEILNKAKELGSNGVFLSGAGPTIMTILERNNDDFSVNMKNYLDNYCNNWSIKELLPDYKGATIKNCDKDHPHL